MRVDNPIICAIDRPDLDGSVALARQLESSVGCIKLGLEFWGAQGPGGVRAVATSDTPVFLDLKLHDIPNTVGGAVRSAASLGIAMLTVHASGGRAMLEAAVAAARCVDEPPLVLAVTVLTSLDTTDLRTIGFQEDPSAISERLASLAVESGIRGIVCSPHEVARIRKVVGPDILLVVPGIRPDPARQDDQKRTMTPRDALDAGADMLVIGRPITRASDPRAMAIEIGRSVAARGAG